MVGRGPAGSVVALLLARAGVRVALLEASAFEEPRVRESVAPNVRGLLEDWIGRSQFQSDPELGATIPELRISQLSPS